MQHLSLSFSNLNAHQIQATLLLSLDHAQTLILQLPRWIPGSYLLRDFAKHLSIRSVHDHQGNNLAFERLDLSRWQLHAPAGEVSINYSIYGFDTSVRANYVCESYVFINPTACALFVEAWRDHPYQLTLLAPNHKPDWQVHTTLPVGLVDTQGFGHYVAQNYDELIEHPLLVGDAVVIDFDACGIAHRMVLVDEAPLENIDKQRLINDLSAICTTEQTFWQNQQHALPFNGYLFQVMVSHDGYGGLEHTNSTALMTSRASLPRVHQKTSKAYEDFLGLCAHEYFHVWLVKRIKPEGLIRPKLDDAVITPLLWIFEGFTSLYDDWMLLRSERIKTVELLARWSDSLTRTLTTTGASQQSLADASREAWIKFYQPNENSANSQVSYYTRGMATALLLLAELHQHGVHLDDLLQRWWQDWQQQPNQALTPAKVMQDLQTLCAHVNWPLWLAQYVEEPNPLLAEQLALQLPQLGLVLTAKLQPSLGVKLAEEQGALIVKQVTSDSPAHTAGWQVGDELIALENWRVRNATHVEQQLAIWQANPNSLPLVATLNRKGYLITTAIQPRLMATTYELAAINESSLTWLKP